tara:strand:- start:3804 stop:4346 length:543 start_codon:yes stop_codon:yes gene_type:complete
MSAMQTYSFSNYTPEISEDCFLAPGSHVIGQAKIEKGVNIWFNSVVRADVNKIFIGENTNIQDLAILHVTSENALKVGKNVTVGHSAILHACTIEDHCLIGMGAKILDGAVIGAGSLVAAGSIVPPHKVYPPNSFILGSPAKRLRELNDEEKSTFHDHYKSYLQLTEVYQDESTHRLLSK